MRVLVVTVVHTPLDARIHARQIAALRAAGHDVTYVAPFQAHGAAPCEVHPGVLTFDVPRAVGRGRSAAWRAARRHVKQLAPRHDVVLLHDPELVVALRGLRVLRGRLVILDVHEDTGAALVDKAWLPEALRPFVAAGVRRLEVIAQRDLRLLLAEERYVDRFPADRDGFPHPVVPNTPVIPDQVPEGPSVPPRVVHVGRLSVLRGVRDLLEVGRLLQGECEVHLIGSADADVIAEVKQAHAAGTIIWHGFVPNNRALSMIEGATAGLALLHDAPNYRVSMPTKLWEYLGRGVPVVTTPLPLALAALEEAGVGTVVPFGDPEAVVAAVRALCADPAQARAHAVVGHEYVRTHRAWNADGPAFVAQMLRWSSNTDN
ncbi:MAG: glycosyltransferase involved in cell wall biosynthesis [Glaciecola sp.]